MPKIKDRTELKIVEFLDENGPSFLGEVVKELKLSYTKGLSNINKLISKGIIRRATPSSQFEIKPDSK